MYMTDAAIRAVFEGADDFEVRQLRSGTGKLYAYFIDGMVNGGAVAEYIFRPVIRDLPVDISEAYDAALNGGIYNAVARPVKNLADAAQKLVKETLPIIGMHMTSSAAEKFVSALVAAGAEAVIE